MKLRYVVFAGLVFLCITAFVLTRAQEVTQKDAPEAVVLVQADVLQLEVAKTSVVEMPAEKQALKVVNEKLGGVIVATGSFAQ